MCDSRMDLSIGLRRKSLTTLTSNIITKALLVEKNFENRFRLAVEAIGGKKIDEKRWPVGRPVADFIFDNEAIVVELKSMAEDRILSPAVIKKASSLYEKARRRRESPVIVFGRAEVSTEGFPDWYEKAIFDLYKKPILEQVIKANRQIRASKDVLSKHEYKGLFVLANSGNSALGHEQACSILQDIFKRPSYSCIDAVLYVSESFSGASKKASHTDKMYLGFNRRGHAVIDESFYKRLSDAWYGL